MKYKIGLLFLVCSFFSVKIYGETQSLDYIKIIVNDEILTNNEYQSTYHSLREQIIRTIPEGKQRNDELNRLEELVKERMIDELLLLDQANNLNDDVSDQEIDNHIKNLEKNNPQVIANYDPGDLRELVAKDYLKQKIISQEVGSKVRITKEEVVQFCQEAVERDKEIELAQIVLNGPKEEVMSKSEVIQKKLADGVGFEELVLNYSDAPSTNGGVIGFFKEGQLLPQIDRVAFALKPGKLSKPVKMQDGFHLFYIKRIKYSDGVDCNELSQEDHRKYSNTLYRKKEGEALKAYLNNLKKTAQIIAK